MLARISLRFGLRGQWGPCAPAAFGMATLKGGDGEFDSSADISSASSADQPSVKAEQG